MAKRSESRRSRPVRSPEAVGGESSGALAKLGERFELFRAQHGAGARVPDELRAAVFEALSEGMTVKDLRRECGLAGSQIDGWEGTRKRASESGQRQSAKVRAFAVVKDEPAGEGATPKAAAEQALELRVGPWAVSVRLAGQTPAGQG